jgi:hypothetical protein
MSGQLEGRQEMKAVAIIALIVARAGFCGAEPRFSDQELAQRAAAIKPVSEELSWQQIPWITDLADGQRLARTERRPIFLWVTGDDPLERC